MSRLIRLALATLSPLVAAPAAQQVVRATLQFFHSVALGIVSTNLRLRTVP